MGEMARLTIGGGIIPACQGNASNDPSASHRTGLRWRRKSCSIQLLREQSRQNSRQAFSQAPVLGVERVQHTGGNAGVSWLIPVIASAGYFRPVRTRCGFSAGDIEVLTAGFLGFEIDLDGEVPSALDYEWLELWITDFFAGNRISCRYDHVPPRLFVIPCSAQGWSIER